ncbi:MAG TPA: hypothetical protein VGP55_00825 [Chitinophagaceae bacterium]|nr:hypothetical protein [Chitinophagaceae bacterium]
MLKYFFIFLYCIVPASLAAQNDSSFKTTSTENIDSLKIIYGRHKHLLKEFEMQTLIALSYYPELWNENIICKYKGINSSAQTTMTFGSIFKKTDKRYIIYINNDSTKTGMLINDAPYNAQLAVIGHELAHIVDFKSRAFFDLALWGLKYLFVKTSTKIERKTDRITIQHGLGLSLYYWADYILNQSTANKRYKKIKEKKYMHPDEILQYMTLHKLPG